jgi:superfamily II DNA/RNA helicase
MSQQSFRELGASRPVVDALAARSIHQPFRIQELVLPDALAGLDVLAKSPTGSGKTLAFAVPIVERTTTNDPRPSALVLVPTRELASQVTEDIEPLAQAKGLSVASVYGGKPMGAQSKRAKKAHVLVATPGRLQDLADRRMVDLSGIRILVLDEADRCSTWASSRRSTRSSSGCREIARRCSSRPRSTAASASSPAAYTNSPVRIEGELSSAQPAEIEHQFVSVTNDTKVETLVEHIRASESTLVFVRTKRGADRLVQKLARHGVTAAAMHGDMSQGARERALSRFESGKVATLVATDVAARGLDLDDVTHVINFDPPDEDKGLRPPHRPHRQGRTQRHGDHLRAPGSAGGDEPSRATARPPRAVRAGRDAFRPREARVHEPPR